MHERERSSFRRHCEISIIPKIVLPFAYLPSIFLRIIIDDTGKSKLFKITRTSREQSLENWEGQAQTDTGGSENHKHPRSTQAMHGVHEAAYGPASSTLKPRFRCFTRRVIDNPKLIGRF